jgi:hypothetical protein
LQAAGRSLSVEWHVADDPIPTTAIDQVPTLRMAKIV